MADETVWAAGARAARRRSRVRGGFWLRPSGTEALIRVMVEAKTVEIGS